MASIKNCLIKLTQENMDMSINKHVKFLIDSVDDGQLLYKLSSTNGIKIDNNMIHLWYHPGIGFQCKNMWEDKYGKLPICGRIERFLNKELKQIDEGIKWYSDGKFSQGEDIELQEFEYKLAKYKGTFDVYILKELDNNMCILYEEYLYNNRNNFIDLNKNEIDMIISNSKFITICNQSSSRSLWVDLHYKIKNNINLQTD